MSKSLDVASDKPSCHLIFSVRVKGDGFARVYLSQNGGIPSLSEFNFLDTLEKVHYDSFCDDFGPMNFLSLVRFIEALHQEIQVDAAVNLVLRCKKGSRAFTNSAFLLGCYLILKANKDPMEVFGCFSGIDSSMFNAYRDATYSKSDFDLQLIDCWSGLKKAQELTWIACPTGPTTEWGMIEPDEYDHYDNPFNGDLHEVVPGKLVAFRGPKDLGGAEYQDDYAKGSRDFSPAYYVNIFKVLGVTTVVRLNRPRYNARDFAARGIEHHDLYFEDCTAPPTSVVGRFLQIVESAPGLVAVHCKAGLGRTGTLIALYMMKHHGFTARAAMGWLRIMRPGSVIGEQQHFLCSMERLLTRKSSSSRLPPVSPASAPPSPACRTPAQLPASPPAEAAAQPPAAYSAALGRRASVAAPLQPCAAAAESDASGPSRAGRNDPAVLARQLSQGMHRRSLAMSMRSLIQRTPGSDSDARGGAGAGVEKPRQPAAEPAAACAAAAAASSGGGGGGPAAEAGSPGLLPRMGKRGSLGRALP